MGKRGTVGFGLGNSGRPGTAEYKHYPIASRARHSTRLSLSGLRLDRTTRDLASLSDQVGGCIVCAKKQFAHSIETWRAVQLSSAVEERHYWSIEKDDGMG